MERKLATMRTDHPTLLQQLCDAVNTHDLDAVVGCFSETYRNDTPAHPGRSFTGTAQVRRNWERIFAGLPDITADIRAAVVDGDAIWSEWEMTGTRPDGTPEALRGVIIFGVNAEQLDSARFYLEPVDAGTDGHDGAVGRLVGDPIAEPSR